MTRRLLLPAWCATLVVALVALHLLADSDLAVPAQPRAWATHVDAVGPAAMIVGLLRLVAMGLAWYLVVVTVAGACGRALQRRRAVAVTDALSPRFLRRLLASAGGLAVSGAGLALATAPLVISNGTADAAADHRPGVATFRQLSPVAIPVPSTASTSDDAETERGEERSTAVFSVLDLSGLGASLADAVPAPIMPSVDDTWQVDCGDHLWLIAEEVLTDALGAPPDDDATTEYWLRLITANRSRLVAPDNPDLLVPGQVLTIPAPPVVS